MMHGAKDVEIDTISAFNDEYDDSIPRFSAEVGRDEGKPERRRNKCMIIACVLLTLSSIILMMYDGPRKYLRDKGNDMKEAHYSGALSNFRDYASLNPYGSKPESNKTTNEEDISEDGINNNNTMEHPEASYHFFEEETSFTYDDVIGYHEDNDNDIEDNETLDEQEGKDGNRTRSEDEDFSKAGDDILSDNIISSESGEGGNNSQGVDDFDFADEKLHNDSTMADNENNTDNVSVSFENDNSSISDASVEEPLENNDNSNGDETDFSDEGSKDTEELKTESNNSATEDEELFKDKNDLSASNYSIDGEGLESESSNLRSEDFEILIDEDEVPSQNSDFPGDGDENVGELNNKDNDIGDEKTEDEPQIQKEEKDDENSQVEELRPTNNGSVGDGGSEEDAHQTNAQQESFDEVGDQKEIFEFEDSGFADDDPIQDEEYPAEIVNNPDDEDLSKKKIESGEIDVEGQQGEDKREYEIISNGDNEDSTLETNEFIESDSGLDHSKGSPETNEVDNPNENEKSEYPLEVKNTDNNEGYLDKTDSYDDYDGDDDKQEISTSGEGSDTDYLFGPSDNIVLSGESGESKYPEYVVHHKVDPLYPDKNTEEGSSSYDHHSASKGKEESKHEAKDQLHNDKYSSSNTLDSGFEQEQHTGLGADYSAPDILNGSSSNQMDVNKFGDVNQPYVSGHDVPFLWYIPRSAATSLENMLTRCHGMVLAGTKGSMGGAAEEKVSKPT